MSHWFCQDPSMSMKILNFHYNHSRQNTFHCYYVVLAFVIGNRFLHIYVEAVICPWEKFKMMLSCLR